jgi:hypothetical protein
MPQDHPLLARIRSMSGDPKVLHWMWLLSLFVAALAVRLHWNLEIHPLGDYVYSDMRGYVTRAQRLLESPTEPHEYSSFFPYGTHVMVAGLMWLFGPERFDVIGIVYASMGAITVTLAYAAARRATAFPIVAPAVGLLGVFYYPHLSLGGYILSEVPFCMFLTGALFFALRLVDEGRHFDAWGMGLCCAFGMIFRPQMLLSAAAVGLFWLARRKHMPKLRFVHLMQSAVPVLALLAVSSALLHFNTGRVGLISENGSFNLVFGRCHNSRIESLPDGRGHGKVHFRPPPFLQLNNLEEAMRKKGETPPRTLNPAIGDEIQYKGYIGDKTVHREFIRRCIEKTGWRGQLEYSATNVMLLWRWNIPWPDSGRAVWRPPARWWTKHHREWLAIPALLALVTVFFGGRRTAKQGLVAVNLLALLLLAAIYFGGTRHRTPYDFVIIILAFETYAFVAMLVWRRLERLWRRRAERYLGPRSAQASSSSKK